MFDLNHQYTMFGNAAPGQALDYAEETAIRNMGGLKREGGELVNKRHQMSEDRYQNAKK